MSDTNSGPFVLVLDSSQILDFLQCPTLWYWKNLRLIETNFIKREAMDKGTILHGLFERYYGKLIEGENPNTAQKYAISELKKDNKKQFGFDKEVIDFLIQRFTQYAAYYLLSGDFIPKKVEQGFSKTIFENDHFLFVLEGRIDFIGLTKESTPRKIVMDHKTQEKYKYLYPKSIQFRNYALASDINLGCINYVGLQQNIEDYTFKRDAFSFSSGYLAWWKEEVIKIFFRVAHTILTNRFLTSDAMSYATCQNNGWGYVCQFAPLCEERYEQIREGLIQIQYHKIQKWEPWSLDERGK